MCRLRGQRAVAALREAFCFHAKRMVKSRPVVFPSKGRRKFHQLCIVELFPQPCKQLVGHFDGSLRHAIGVFQDQPFLLRE